MHLLDLVSRSDLEAISETFEAAVGLPVLFADAEGRPVGNGFDTRRFCTAFLTGTGADTTNTCLWCDRREDRAGTTLEAADRALASGGPVMETCPGGFLDVAVPIVVDGSPVGYGVFGRTLDAPPDMEAFRGLAGENGLDVDRCLDILKATPIMPRDRVEAVARHLQAVTDVVIGIAAEHGRALQEMALVGELQRGLVPTEHFVDGFDIALSFRPASSTGGDLLNAFRLGGGDSVLYVGDVAGSGVPAALVMSLLSGVLGAERHANVWPATTLSALNEAFERHFTDDRCFATMFYARYIARESQLIYASAGHEPSYLVRASDGLVEELSEPRGCAIGLAPRATYTHGRTNIQPGDTLVLYTDGLLERKTRAGEWMEPTDLPALLRDVRGKPVDRAVRHVVDALDGVSGTGQSESGLPRGLPGPRRAGSARGHAAGHPAGARRGADQRRETRLRRAGRVRQGPLLRRRQAGQTDRY